MDLGLKDKVIIVTGGAKGIGESIVKLLASEGAFPIIFGRNEDDNKKTLQSIERGAQYKVELTNPTECIDAVNRVIEQ